MSLPQTPLFYNKLTLIKILSDSLDHITRLQNKLFYEKLS